MFQLLGLKVKMPVREYKFHPKRRWRFDFAWPDEQLAVEVEGGQWISGRHNSGKGFEQDCEKYEAALLDGWIVYRTTPTMVKTGRAAQSIQRLLEMRNVINS